MSQTYPNTIKRVFLYWHGDDSVGIPSHELVIEDDPLIDCAGVAEEDVPGMVDGFRHALAAAFAIVNAGPPSVEFDFEYEAREREYDAAILAAMSGVVDAFDQMTKKVDKS